MNSVVLPDAILTEILAERLSVRCFYPSALPASVSCFHFVLFINILVSLLRYCWFRDRKGIPFVVKCPTVLFFWHRLAYAYVVSQPQYSIYCLGLSANRNWYALILSTQVV